jgi:hypothetical protein
VHEATSELDLAADVTGALEGGELDNLGGVALGSGRADGIVDLLRLGDTKAESTGESETEEDSGEGRGTDHCCTMEKASAWAVDASPVQKSPVSLVEKRV